VAFRRIDETVRTGGNRSIVNDFRASETEENRPLTTSVKMIFPDAIPSDIALRDWP
jgi:hypothetical protein